MAAMGNARWMAPYWLVDMDRPSGLVAYGGAIALIAPPPLAQYLRFHKRLLCEHSDGACSS